MKQLLFKTVLITTLCACTLPFTSCKSGSSGNTADSTITTVPTDNTTAEPAPAPVVISSDDSLTNTVKDATKDFPGLTASVSNGEITLTGDISRDKLPTLMQSLNALHPKKIHNNLTIK